MLRGITTETADMPDRFSVLSSLKLIIPALLLLAALFPAPLAARDQIEYGRYLGTRLRMYEESYKVLDEVIKQSSGAQKARARQAKAEVMKTEADNTFAENGDAEARLDRYKAALDVFGDPSDPTAVRAKAEMMLDVAKELQAADPALARTFCDDAAKLLDAKRKELDAERNNKDVDFSGKAEVYNSIFYQYCRSYYVKALTFGAGTDERERELKFAEKWLDEFAFESEGITRDFVLSYELRGDVALARGNVENAVTEFFSLVSFLENEPPSAFVGNIALPHGYLRAVELITTELDYDPARLQQAIDKHAEAYARYGAFSELDFWFKRFELFRISALIKQGKAENIRGAVELLFRLAGDRDAAFRRSAITVLADVATRPELTDEMRFRCAETVFGEMATNPPNVILRNIQAYQALLVACTDQKKFETYAPACFARIADMYGAMWRFMEAALICKEATYRTGYFREKFETASEVPEHMRGRCPLIKDAETLRGFPGQMASLAARNAGFLVNEKYGDPGNRDLVRFKDEMDRLKAEWGDASAQLDLIFRKARELYDQKEYSRAAAKYLNLPSNYRNYHIAVYAAAKAYYNLTININAPRMNTFGVEDEKETPEFFAAQQARHAKDFATLPESLWKGVAEAHLPAVTDTGIRDSLANWHKAAYFYKKYFLLETLRHWDEVQPLLSETQDPTLADAIAAVSQVKNMRWLAANPTEQGDPDLDMRRMGFAAYELAYMLRNLPVNIDDQSKNALLARERDLAVGILRPYWNMYRYHVGDNDAYRSASQHMAFLAMIEARDVEASEQLYISFKEAFPESDKLRGMVSLLYGLVLDIYSPRAAALLTLNADLESRSAVMKKNAYERIDPQAYPEDAKKLAEAKTRIEIQRALAEHFWKVWMVEKAFKREGTDAIAEYITEVQATVEARWKKMGEEYPKRWGEALQAELKSQLAQANYAPIKAIAEKAAQGEPTMLLERLEAEAQKQSGNNQQLMQQLVTSIKLNTDELQWFVGAVFIYEFGGFLETVAADVVDRARPMFARILKYLEEHRVLQGAQGLQGMNPADVRRTGGYYFLIRDWQNAVRYLEVTAEREKANWGKVEEIPVDPRQKIVGRTANADELAVRYMLGKSYLELHKQSGEQDHLVKAALHLRRCICFNEIRDTVALSKGADWKLSFQKELEQYYVAGAQAMAETYVLLHKQKDLKIDWPKYVSQQTTTLEPKKENGEVVLQPVPKDGPGYLWFAAQSRLKIWASFTELSAYQYRTEYRNNLVGWIELMIEWKRTYGADKAPAGVDAKQVSKLMSEAATIAKRESEFKAAYMTDDTKQHVATMKKLAEAIEKK